MHELPLNQLQLETFTPFLNSAFRVLREPGSSVELILFEATPSRNGLLKESIGSEDTHTSFSLLFRGPMNRVLSQGTYRFEHEQLGSFVLFLVPVGPGGGGLRYEVVFNREPVRT